MISAKAKEMGSPAYEVKRTDTEIIRNTSAGIDFYSEMSIMGIQFSQFRLLRNIR
mgnify:CR=1 FL=1